VTVATHRSSERHPADRGLQFGRAQSRAVANTVAVYQRMLREDRGLGPSDVGERGREAAARIRAFRPALAEEIEGIASGAGQAPDVLFAINARTELLAGGLVAGTAGECSTVAVLDRQRASGVLAQNWDFHPDLAASRVLWTVDDGDERRFTTFTEAGILAKIGSNANGVALAINFLATDLDGGLDGVPVHVLCRAVLEEARTVGEARDLIAGSPVSASVCMTVAGPDGLDGAAGVAACALERWPGGTEEQAAGPERPWVAHTNHFLDSIAARDTLADGPSGPSTHGRMDRLVATLEGAPTLEGRQIAELLGSRGGPGVAPIFQTDDPTLPWLERCATLATIGLEVPSGRLWLV
jgi:isopenicillin-N N-acyltransferase-like protein